MMPHSFSLPRKVGYAALVLALAGCSRSTVVGTPENSSLADGPPVPEKIVRAQAEETEPAPFAFPDDAGGELLAKVLPPKDMEPTVIDRPPSPRRALGSAFDKPPALPLPPSRADVPRLPANGRRLALCPRLVAEETLGTASESLRLPPTPPMLEKGRIRVPSPDVNQPIPLPILAHPVSDRATLDDPTLDVSTAAALAAPIPPRSSKAPFLKQTLPDPYDRRRDGAPSPEETKEFPLGSPQTPRR
jgi:hypothetical protein